MPSFAIVSHPLHMMRAIILARNTGISVYSSPTPRSAYKSAEAEWLCLSSKLVVCSSNYLNSLKRIAVSLIIHGEYRLIVCLSSIL